MHQLRAFNIRLEFDSHPLAPFSNAPQTQGFCDHHNFVAARNTNASAWNLALVDAIFPRAVGAALSFEKEKYHARLREAVCGCVRACLVSWNT